MASPAASTTSVIGACTAAILRVRGAASAASPLWSAGAPPAHPVTTIAIPSAAASIPARDFLIVRFSSGWGVLIDVGCRRSAVVQTDGGAVPDGLDGEHAEDDDDDRQVHQAVVVDLVAVPHREVADAAAADDAQHGRGGGQADG